MFDRDLLSRPVPNFYDDSETLWKIYQYINRKLYKKCMRCPIRMKKFDSLLNEFLELYGRAKAKEIEFEEKNGESFQRPFDYFRLSGRNNKGIFIKIKFRS